MEPISFKPDNYSFPGKGKGKEISSVKTDIYEVFKEAQTSRADLKRNTELKGRLLEGPLRKSSYTKKLEEGLKQIFADFDQTKIKSSGGKFYIQINGQYFDLIDLLQNANPNHLIFEENDYQNIFDMIVNKKGLSEKTIKALNHLDSFYNQSFVQVSNCPGTLRQKVERASLAIYTRPEYFRVLNELQRGNLTDIKYLDKKGAATSILKFLLMHTAMISVNLNDYPETMSNLSRHEKTDELPKSIIQERQDNIEGKVPYVMARALTSTSIGKEEPKDCTVVRLDNAHGKDIAYASEICYEHEFLVPPSSQIQYYRKTVDSNNITYFARFVRTPEGLNDKQLGKADLKPVKFIFGIKI